MPITLDMLADLARHSIFLIGYALAVICVFWIVERIIRR